MKYIMWAQISCGNYLIMVCSMYLHTTNAYYKIITNHFETTNVAYVGVQTKIIQNPEPIT